MDATGVRTVLGMAATVLTCVAFVPYTRSILWGTTRPHVFSWIIWGINTNAAFWTTLYAGGGEGALVIGFSDAVTLLIALLAYLKRADVTVTRSDRCF